MTDSEHGITFDKMAESLYEDMITIILRQQTLQAWTNHISREQMTDDANSDKMVNPAIFNRTDTSKDIYGQDKVKLKTSETSRYFACENCGRKIAGSRYAQHINKCLDRKRKW